MSDRSDDSGYVSTGAKREDLTGPIALFADVHGNIRALEAVLAACASAGVGAYFVAGDLLLHGEDPLGVWKRLTELNARMVRGTSDLALTSVDARAVTARSPQEREALERFEWTRKAVGELILQRLKKLPDQLRIELSDGSEIVISYGSPVDSTEPLEHSMTDDELADRVGSDPADVVVSGGADVPFVRDVKGVRFVGLGSVGDAPRGERVAHFTLVLPGGEEGVLIEQRWVEW